MFYDDYYDLAVYCNENWKGNFTPKEVACNAYDLLCECQVSRIKNEFTNTIKTLLSNLEEDNTEEAKEWIEKIKGTVYGNNN